jgi:subtilisin family serine protease
MKRRLFAALAASALIILTVVPASTTAASPQKRFTRIDPDRIDKALVAAVLADRAVEVIVELNGTPAIRRDLSKQQRVEIAGRLEANQAKLDAPIRKLGGRIEAKFQYAYNGLKVRLNGKQLTALSKLPGVKAVHAVPIYRFENKRSVKFINTPAVWQGYGVTGNGQTIAVIDSGIDYTHANFGGAGTEAAYDANDSTVIEASSFPTAKVIAGWDFVGDDYDPSADDGSEIPAPDPDPLDCQGHGSHVAGTAAGFGVKLDHTTYTGPYNTATHNTAFGIGPGVAPRANLVALKVFGCDGGTSVITEALEWVGEYNMTHADAIDVVNMSLGGIGGDYTPASVAANALVAAGVSVVASAGNEGPNAFMTGAPGNARGVISVGATDTTQSFPGAIIDRATGTDLNASNQNDYPELPVSGTLAVIDNGSGGLSLGCEAADYGVLPANSVAIIQRGVCAFVDKGAAAEEAGAVGVIVVNRDDIADPNELPTFVGYTPSIFDIPMIGIGRGAKATLQASNGVGVTLKAGAGITNPAYLAPADFTSGGPALGDNAQKPDVAAPGVNITSTGAGLGFKGDTFSGTSMASPHVAGVAALVRAKNPTWQPDQVKAAIVGTAVVSKIVPYNPRLSGSGMVWPVRAVDTSAFVLAGDRTPSLSFGYDPTRNGAYRETKHFTIYNRSSSAITYKLVSPGIVTLSATTVTVPARSSRTINATASLTATQLAATKFASQTVPGGTTWGSLVNYQGVITATPTVGGRGRYPLRIVYRAVPRAASNVVPSGLTDFESDGTISSASITLKNTGIHRTFADVYAWGLSDPLDLPTSVTSTNDIRAVGLQVLPAEVLTGTPDDEDRALIWAINTHGRWSGGFQNVFTIAIFGDDPEPDFLILAIDLGLATADDFNGQMVSLVLTGDGTTILDAWVADAPANGSTILIPALASDIDRTDPDATVDYEVVGENIVSSTQPADGFVDEVEGRASLSVFEPALSQGDFVPLNVGQSSNLGLAFDEAGQSDRPSKGWMIVSLDDPNGAPQADLVPAPQP